MTATGTVLASSPTSLVIRTDVGQGVAFSLDGNSNLPAGVATGDRVTVRYGGSLGAFRATTVTLTPRQSATTTSGSNPGRRLPSPVDEAVRTSQEQSLPDTASPVPGMAFLGMAALGAGLGLKAVRRHATPR
jgi:hypothetical protein